MLGFMELVPVTEEDAKTVPLQLLRADSLLAQGRNQDCLMLLAAIESSPDWQMDRFGNFLAGLRSLANGRSVAAYASFVAAMQSDDEAQVVIAGRRATSLGFGISSAKMLDVRVRGRIRARTHACTSTIIRLPTAIGARLRHAYWTTIRPAAARLWPISPWQMTRVCATLPRVRTRLACWPWSKD